MMGKSKYPGAVDGEEMSVPSDATVLFACCDCGLVHAFRFKGPKTTFRVHRMNGSTGQLRRHEHGDLHRGIHGWKLVRNDNTKRQT